MKKIILIALWILAILPAFAQNASIFTDSIPGLKEHAKKGNLETLRGIYMQFAVDEDGPYITASYSRIGRKWGYHLGLQKRVWVGFLSAGIYGPYPGLNAGGEFYLNRLHTTVTPFFHGNALAEYVGEQGIGLRTRIRMGYGNLIHLGKYFNLDWRAGLGLSLGEEYTEFASGFFSVGVAYNIFTYGRDHPAKNVK
ncbi:MAG: hypothetical protein AAF998_29230 [Bacteroidota bacterium]